MDEGSLELMVAGCQAGPFLVVVLHKTPWPGHGQEVSNPSTGCFVPCSTLGWPHSSSHALADPIPVGTSLGSGFPLL